MLDDLAWGGNDAAMPPMKQPVYVGDRKFGSFQRAGNITYVLVYNSSHMVPINEPSGMLALLDDMLGIAPVQLTPSLNEQSQAPNSNSTGAPISSAQPDRFGAGFGTGMLVTIVLVAVIGAIALYRRPVLRRIWRQRGPKLHRSADQIGMDPLTTMTQPDHEVLFSHDDHEDGDDEEAVLGRVSQLGYHSGSDSESEGRRPRMR
ncbi:hypothetical protein BC828DRAFT_59137 [Blastocladiella britannica]|nr:hypothetical protein BC828DRAFT_59137 [Blastocladiella britannica]